MDRSSSNCRNSNSNSNAEYFECTAQAGRRSLEPPQAVGKPIPVVRQTAARASNYKIHVELTVAIGHRVVRDAGHLGACDGGSRRTQDR